MVLNTSLANITALIPNPLEIISSSLSSTLAPLMGLFKAIGIVILIYIIFLIVKSFLNIRTTIRIKQISQDVKEIKEKINLLTKNNLKKK